MEMAKAGQVMAFNLAELTREFLVAHLPENPKPASLWESMRQREQVHTPPPCPPIHTPSRPLGEYTHTQGSGGCIHLCRR
jgi:hypothetical protein